jgi:GH24 family phage-related lysozyme (muramidase)
MSRATFPPRPGFGLSLTAVAVFGGGVGIGISRQSGTAAPAGHSLHLAPVAEDAQLLPEPAQNLPIPSPSFAGNFDNAGAIAADATKAFVENCPAVIANMAELQKQQVLQDAQVMIYHHEGNSKKVYFCTSEKETYAIGINLRQPANVKLIGDLFFDGKQKQAQKFVRDLINRKPGVCLTEDQVQTLFVARVEMAYAEAEAQLRLHSQQKLGMTDLPGNVQTALVSMAFNARTTIGPRLTKMLAAGDYANAACEVAFNTSNNNKAQSPGIGVRRMYEGMWIQNAPLTAEQEQAFAQAPDLRQKMAKYSAELRKQRQQFEQEQQYLRTTDMQKLRSLTPVATPQVNAVDPKTLPNRAAWLGTSNTLVLTLDAVAIASMDQGGEVLAKITPTDSPDRISRLIAGRIGARSA